MYSIVIIIQVRGQHEDILVDIWIIGAKLCARGQGYKRVRLPTFQELLSEASHCSGKGAGNT